MQVGKLDLQKPTAHRLKRSKQPAPQRRKHWRQDESILERGLSFLRRKELSSAPQKAANQSAIPRLKPPLNVSNQRPNKLRLSIDSSANYRTRRRISAIAKTIVNFFNPAVGF
jgi:hypothetical protein